MYAYTHLIHYHLFTPTSSPLISSFSPEKELGLHLDLFNPKSTLFTKMLSMVLLMVQKYGDHQLRFLVQIPFFTGFGIHARWLALGFLNHQQYYSCTKKTNSNLKWSKKRNQMERCNTICTEIKIHLLSDTCPNMKHVPKRLYRGKGAQLKGISPVCKKHLGSWLELGPLLFINLLLNLGQKAWAGSSEEVPSRSLSFGIQ